MAQYSIKDLEDLSGIKAHTLRVWEQRYKLIQPERTASNIRFYNDEQLKLLLNIALLNKSGVKISKIANLSKAEIFEKTKKLSVGPLRKAHKVKELLLLMADMKLKEFAKLIDDISDEIGFVKTIEEVIFPYLHRIGGLWASDAISPLHEHATSNIIRQKIISRIDSLQRKERKIKGKAVLFLPEGEWHEISLLFSHFLFLDAGIDCIYFGACQPMLDFNKLPDGVQNADLFFSVLTMKPLRQSVEEYIREVKSQLKGGTLLLTGVQLMDCGLCFPDGVVHLKTVNELKQYLIDFQPEKSDV